MRAADLVFVGVVQSIEHLTARRAGNGILRASLVSPPPRAVRYRVTQVLLGEFDQRDLLEVRYSTEFKTSSAVRDNGTWNDELVHDGARLIDVVFRNRDGVWRAGVGWDYPTRETPEELARIRRLIRETRDD